MARIGTDIEEKILNLFKQYSKSQHRSMKEQIAWMIEDILFRNGYLEKNNRVTIAEKYQAGLPGKASGQPGTKD